MRVGCRLTSVARNEANSEYLRFTSRPCTYISSLNSLWLYFPYTAIDSVLYEVDIVLPCLGDENELPWVLI